MGFRVPYRRQQWRILVNERKLEPAFCGGDVFFNVEDYGSCKACASVNIMKLC